MTLLRTAFDKTLRRAYVASRDGATNLLFERRGGIATAGEIELEQLGLAGTERTRYKPSGWLTLRRILPPREVSPEDVFIDFGSGMGRIVFQAAKYPFRRVIGVEISESLNAIATDNVERNRDRLQCQDIQLVTSDVLEYEVPDDVTVAFFANPFTGGTFATVVDRLIASVDRDPRRLRLVYVNPVEHEHLVVTGRFRPVRKIRGMRPGREWSRSNSTRMYELIPKAAAGTGG